MADNVGPAARSQVSQYIVASASQQSAAPSTAAPGQPSAAAVQDIRTLHDDYQKQSDALGEAGKAWLNDQLSDRDYEQVRSTNLASWQQEVQRFAPDAGRKADLTAAMNQVYGGAGGTRGWADGLDAVSDPSLQAQPAAPGASPPKPGDAATASIRYILDH